MEINSSQYGMIEKSLFCHSLMLFGEVVLEFTSEMRRKVQIACGFFCLFDCFVLWGFFS